MIYVKLSALARQSLRERFHHRDLLCLTFRCDVLLGFDAFREDHEGREQPLLHPESELGRGELRHIGGRLRFLSILTRSSLRIFKACLMF